MKLVLSILFISIFIFTTAKAQDGNLSVDLQKIQNTDNWEFNLNYQVDNLNSTGIFIELPENFKVTPISIKVNDQDLWLKNSTETTVNDSVIHWENTENGLILRFSENLFQYATLLSIKCISLTNIDIDDDTIISIRSMINNDQISDEVIVSNNLNIIR
jgi:hypothetical protein